MGVTGLWKLIDASGKPVPLETLENKVLAVDISIWLHQVVKGFQDANGATLVNAHLLGLFHRLCKLLYYRIKPVFVFDGGVPALKRETIAKRSQSKSKYQNESDRFHKLLLETLAKERIVQQALGNVSANNLLLSSPTKIVSATILQREQEKEALFKLPAVTPSDEANSSSATAKSDPHNVSSGTDYSDSEQTTTEKRRHYHNVNLHSIDVNSVKFKSLPPDIRVEILNDLKETRKQSSWGRLHELPAQSDDFSEYQMKRLLKRRQVQVSLEEAEQEMGGKSLSLMELEALLTEDGIMAAPQSNPTNRVTSDQNTRYLHVCDLKQAIKTGDSNNGNCSTSGSSSSSPPKKSKLDVDEMVVLNTINESEDAYDSDLQQAIELSLIQECIVENNDNNAPISEEENGEICDKDTVEEYKMSSLQKKNLSGAAKNLARAYMVEYGGLNDDDIKRLVKQRIEENPENNSQEFKYNDKYITKGEDADDDDVSSNADSDFIDVPEISDSSDLEARSNIVLPIKWNHSPGADLSKDFRLEDLQKSTKLFKIEIKPEAIEKFNNAEDLFADVFNVKKSDDNGNIKDNTQGLINEKITNNDTEINDVIDKNHVDSEQLKNELENQIEIDISQNIDAKNIEINELIKQRTTNIPDNDQKLPKTNDEIPENKLQSDLNVTIPNVNKIHSEKKIVTPNKITDILNDLNEQMESVSHVNLQNISTVTKHPPSTKTTPKNILNDLDVEMKSVQSINLDNLLIQSASIQNTDNCASIIKDSKLENDNRNDNIIVIDDDDDDDDDAVKVKKFEKQSTLISYFNVTPTKSKIKPIEETSPDIPQPYFVRKSPSSKKKDKTSTITEQNDEFTTNIDSKVSRSLFGKINNAEETINVAANLLKENQSEGELNDLAVKLHSDKCDMERNRNQQERMGMGITQRMTQECKDLLQLFGVPYITAPMEAEAQCAYLNAINLTNGTITNDSDIWLFGGQTVYKHFFNQQKNVLEFNADKIQQLFNVDRHRLIQLSTLVGSDYTTGINGIGAVTALEILSNFTSTPIKDGETTEIMSLLSGLRKFRDWWLHRRTVEPHIGLRNKLKNITISEDFPSHRVIEAYLYPKVDDSREAFKWGYPDAAAIREFAKKNFSWTSLKTNEMLLPVLRKLDERKSQQTIKNYFNVENVMHVNNIKVSKRVRKAIDKLNPAQGTITNDNTNNNDKKISNNKSKVLKKKMVNKKIGKNNAEDADTNKSDGVNRRSTRKGDKKSVIVEEENDKNDNNDLMIPSTSGQSSVMHQNESTETNLNVNDKKIPNIPKGEQPIPQREKDKELQDINKQKAVRILRKRDK